MARPDGIMTTNEYRALGSYQVNDDGDGRTGRAGHCAQSGDRGRIDTSDGRLYVLAERAGSWY